MAMSQFGSIPRSSMPQDHPCPKITFECLMAQWLNTSTSFGGRKRGSENVVLIRTLGILFAAQSIGASTSYRCFSFCGVSKIGPDLTDGVSHGWCSFTLASGENKVHPSRPLAVSGRAGTCVHSHGGRRKGSGSDEI